MPYTSHPRLIADKTAARMTAFNPGASPPPVEIAIRLTSTAEVGIDYSFYRLIEPLADPFYLHIKYIVYGSFRVKSQLIYWKNLDGKSISSLHLMI
jgi:hypothetical protein